MKDISMKPQMQAKVYMDSMHWKRNQQWTTCIGNSVDKSECKDEHTFLENSSHNGNANPSRCD